MTTFVCNKNDYKISDLKKFTINTGALVVIRGYGVIEAGRLTRQRYEKHNH